MMIKINSTTLGRSIEVERIIGHIKGTEKGPTVIMLGGVHGNESSGVFALHDVLQELQKSGAPIKGNFYALCGNMKALEKGVRFCTEDLNRIWTSDRVEQLKSDNLDGNSEEISEQREIYSVLQKILDSEEGPYYFMDLHTTSSETIPFVVVNDTLLNRKFAEQYPLPMILGIEEYLDSALLSYIHELGYVSFGYEAGRNDELSSFNNHIAFIYLSLVYAGNVNKTDIDFQHYYDRLAKTSFDSKEVYEVLYRFKIGDNDSFSMQPGYVNFQKVKKGQELAVRNGERVIASHTGSIFMPLYQQQGKDGFYEIRRIRHFFLRLSVILRNTKFAHILPFLPGIKWGSERRDVMIVDLRVARFFTKQFLHLLGYRSKRIDKAHLIIRNREATSRVNEYNVPWNKG